MLTNVEYETAEILSPQDKSLLKLKKDKSREDNLSFLKTQFYENIKPGETVSFEEFVSLSSIYGKIHNASVERELELHKNFREEYNFIKDLCECLKIPNTYTHGYTISEKKIKTNVLKLSKILNIACNKFGIIKKHISSFIDAYKCTNMVLEHWSGFKFRIISNSTEKSPVIKTGNMRVKNNTHERFLILEGPKYFETYLSKMLSLNERQKIMQTDYAYSQIYKNMDFENLKKLFDEKMLKSHLPDITETTEETNAEIAEETTEKENEEKVIAGELKKLTANDEFFTRPSIENETTEKENEEKVIAGELKKLTANDKFFTRPSIENESKEITDKTETV